MLNKIQKGKRNLIILGITLLVLSILCGVGGVLCTVFSEARWWMILIALVLYALGILGLIVSITFIWVGRAMTATIGNIKEGNIPLENGTINAHRCNNCGADLAEDDEFCKECGRPTSNTKKCAKCNAKNAIDAKICTKCGEKFE